MASREGSFGSVYKGTISGGSKTVVIKRLEKVVGEGQREFQAEMAAIARTQTKTWFDYLVFILRGQGSFFFMNS